MILEARRQILEGWKDIRINFQIFWIIWDDLGPYGRSYEDFDWFWEKLGIILDSILVKISTFGNFCLNEFWIPLWMDVEMILEVILAVFLMPQRIQFACLAQLTLDSLWSLRCPNSPRSTSSRRDHFQNYPKSSTASRNLLQSFIGDGISNNQTTSTSSSSNLSSVSARLHRPPQFYLQSSR